MRPLATSTPPGYEIFLPIALFVVAVVALLMVWFPGAAAIWGVFYGVHRIRGGAKSGIRTFKPKGMLVTQGLWAAYMIGVMIYGVVQIAQGNVD